jgi:hypothetical protein
MLTQGIPGELNDGSDSTELAEVQAIYLPGYFLTYLPDIAHAVCSNRPSRRRPVAAHARQHKAQAVEVRQLGGRGTARTKPARGRSRKDEDEAPRE